MRSNAILIALYAAGVLALPRIEFETVITTVFKTVTHGPSPTSIVQAVQDKTSCETTIARITPPPVVYTPTPVSSVEITQVREVQQPPPVETSVSPAVVSPIEVIPAPFDSKLNTYQNAVLQHHNIHRANHSSPALVWDNGLAATALEIARTCRYGHNTALGGGGYGQNIAAGVKADNIGAVITSLFYNDECGFYDNQYGRVNPDMDNFAKFGHFTQIVWKSTYAVGCVTYDCSGRGLANVGSRVSPHFTVCNYMGPGNFAGEYAENVKPPNGHSIAGSRLP